MTPRTAILLGCTLALSACVTPTGPAPVGGSYATTGAVTGALLGAAAGAAKDDEDRARNAAVGGLIGGLAGGMIGSALDAQARALQSSVSGSTTVVNTGSALVVTMPQDILFATDSAALRPDLTRDLDAVAQNLISYPQSTILITGHTDNTGEAAYNQDLSLRRAQSVANVLRQAGVASARISPVGMGEDAPVASNLTPEGRAQNRRVEITITPTG